MSNSTLLRYSFLHALGVTVYVSLVAGFMRWGEGAIGSQDSEWLGPVAILLLLTLSAAVVGSLIFAKPALLCLDGKRKEGLMMTIYTLGWLLVAFVITVIIVAV